MESGKLQNLESEIGLALKENSNAEDIHNIVIKYSDNNILKTLNNEDLIKSLFSANSLQGILQNVELN